MSRIFYVSPQFETIRHNNGVVTTDLISSLAFNREFVHCFEKINKQFHICTTNRISDTQVSFIMNRGIEEEYFFCILSLVFTIISSQKSIDEIWKDGLEKFFSTADQYPAPGGVRLLYKNDQEVVDKALKVLVNDFVEPWNLTETPRLYTCIFNLDQLKSGLQELASQNNLVFKIFGKSDANTATSYIFEVAKVKQEIAEQLNALTEQKKKIYDFLDFETLSGSTPREEILDTKKAFEDDLVSKEIFRKAIDLFFSGASLLNKYDIYSNWFN